MLTAVACQCYIILPSLSSRSSCNYCKNIKADCSIGESASAYLLLLYLLVWTVPFLLADLHVMAEGKMLVPTPASYCIVLATILSKKRSSQLDL